MADAKEDMPSVAVLEESAPYALAQFSTKLGDAKRGDEGFSVQATHRETFVVYRALVTRRSLALVRHTVPPSVFAQISRLTSSVCAACLRVGAIFLKDTRV